MRLFELPLGRTPFARDAFRGDAFRRGVGVRGLLRGDFPFRDGRGQGLSSLRRSLNGVGDPLLPGLQCGLPLRQFVQFVHGMPRQAHAFLGRRHVGPVRLRAFGFGLHTQRLQLRLGVRLVLHAFGRQFPQRLDGFFVQRAVRPRCGMGMFHGTAHRACRSLDQVFGVSGGARQPQRLLRMIGIGFGT